MRLRCDDSGSEHVSLVVLIDIFELKRKTKGDLNGLLDNPV